jgi:hypothetical protein
MEGPDPNMLFDQVNSRAYEFSGILPRIAIFIQKESER